jgi:hypothetical protein
VNRAFDCNDSCEPLRKSLERLGMQFTEPQVDLEISENVVWSLWRRTRPLRNSGKGRFGLRFMKEAFIGSYGCRALRVLLGLLDCSTKCFDLSRGLSEPGR